MNQSLAPSISVIICTKNRAHAVGPCLDSVVQSFLAAPHMAGEIVVVNNGSTDDTDEVLRAFAATSPISLRIIDEAKPGLSAARNAGIRAASGDVLVFTDDDCRLSLPYIAETLRYDRADGADMVMRSGSVILGDPADLPLTIKSVREKRSWQRPMDVDSEGKLLGDALIGCNMQMRRATAALVGFFDEKLGAGTLCCAAEDTDYFYRAYLKNVRLEMVPDLVLSHYHGRKTIEQKDRLLRNYAIGNGALIAKYLFIYPNFSRHFYWLLKKCLTDTLSKSTVKSRDISYYSMLLLQVKGMILYLRACFSL